MRDSVGELNYRFVDYDWLANASGFDKPTDVYYGKVLIGVITSKPNGYVIEVIMGPKRPQIIIKNKTNMFKTKIDAANMIHKVWKRYRKINLQ